MSTTLTNGLKLPDKGSVDWYADMQSNYVILDGAVGTIAEHTTQIAGKAPAVHTHTKSDVTDLFNSANVWTEANTFSKALTVAQNSDINFFFNAKHTAAELGSLPSSDQALTLAFKDKNDDNLCYARVYYETTGGNSFRIFVRNKYTSGAPSTSGTADYAYFGLKINADKSKEAVFRASLRPYDSSYNYHLGDSTYKWKTLNGINPGALSLPNFDSDGYVDLTSNLTENVQYTYTPTVDGWLALYVQVNGFHAENAVGIFNADTTLGNDSFRWANTATAAINLERQAGKYFGSVFLPVKAGYPYFCWLKVNQSTSLGQKRFVFYKAKGNV